jgi:ABC-type Fe3+-siderophore transport system permease subunit
MISLIFRQRLCLPDAAKTTATVTMDGPKTVTAEWRMDYTMPYIILAVLVALMLAVAGMLFMKRRKV